LATHAYVVFCNKEQSPIVTILHHSDGYISGVGKSLARFLLERTMINGRAGGGNDDDLSSLKANGVYCLAAQYIKEFKTEVGELYIVPCDSSGEYIDYKYYVAVENVEIGQYISCDEITQIIIKNMHDKIIFVGTPKELLNLRTEF